MIPAGEVINLVDADGLWMGFAGSAESLFISQMIIRRFWNGAPFLED